MHIVVIFLGRYFHVLGMIAKNNLPRAFFASCYDHPVQLLPNVIGILFHIRHHFEKECQVDMHDLLSAFTQAHKSAKADRYIYIYNRTFMDDSIVTYIPFFFLMFCE